MTQKSNEESSKTPPTTPIAPNASSVCASCECEGPGKSALEEEALVAVRELASSVKTITISEMLPRTSQLLFINVTTLENQTHCIELTQKGWRIASNRQDCMNGDFRHLDIHTNYFDSIYALLSEISPMYREKFAQQLISKLNQLSSVKKDTDQK